VLDAGDLPVAELAGEPALAAVDTGLAGLPAHDLAVLLGGDNAVTRPALRTLLPDLPRTGLLTLDAHHDVRGFHAGPTNGTRCGGWSRTGCPVLRWCRWASAS
jgi:formiminoglutamase